MEESKEKKKNVILSSIFKELIKLFLYFRCYKIMFSFMKIWSQDFFINSNVYLHTSCIMTSQLKGVHSSFSAFKNCVNASLIYEKLLGVPTHLVVCWYFAWDPQFPVGFNLTIQNPTRYETWCLHWQLQQNRVPP